MWFESMSTFLIHNVELSETQHNSSALRPNVSRERRAEFSDPRLMFVFLGDIGVGIC